MNAVEVVGLGYAYPGRDRPTLADVSFTLPRGSWTLVSGPTGSGKSTLLRALVGLIPHLSKGRMTGAVRLLGRDTRTAAPAELAAVVGFVTQSPDDQLCATTVAGELAFGLENLCLPPAEISRRIAEAAGRFGLADMLKRSTAELSGGMKQRLVLAAITAMRPHVLVCDEPLSQLDPQAAHEFLAELRRLHGEGLTIVMAEHRLDDVSPYADRMLVVEDGTVQFIPHSPFPIPRSATLICRLPIPRSPGAAVVSVDRLSFRFRNVTAPVWSDVSFAVRRGERIAVVGPNGAGKSTLLSVLAGLQRPTAGDVRWSAAAAPQQFSTVLVPQRADLTLLHRTVAAELAYGPRQAGLSSATVAERVELAARMFSLDGLLDELPQALSQGQRVRTAVAAALATAPRVLLLDEPTTGQDVPTMRLIMELLATTIGVPGGPEALLFSTHDLRTAVHYADRVLILAEGKLAADGPTTAILADAELLRRSGLAPSS